MTTMYASTPFDYDFTSELASALASTERPPAALSADQRHWHKQFPDAPTPEALRKHAERFGPEGVEEIADAYGIDVHGSTAVRRTGRITRSRSRRSAQRAKEVLA